MGRALDELVESCRSLHLSYGDRWDLYSWADILLDKNLLQRYVKEPEWADGDDEKLRYIKDRLRSPQTRESLRDFLNCCPERAVNYCEHRETISWIKRRETTDSMDGVHLMWIHIGLYFDQVICRLSLVGRTGRSEGGPQEGDLW